MLDKIKSHQGDGKPLFMYLSFQASHSPFQAPQEFLKKYDRVYDVGYDKIREQTIRKTKTIRNMASRYEASLIDYLKHQHGIISLRMIKPTKPKCWRLMQE